MSLRDSGARRCSSTPEPARNRGLIEEGLASPDGRLRRRRLLVTRREPDAFVNFSWVVQTFGIAASTTPASSTRSTCSSALRGNGRRDQLRHLYKGDIDNIQPGLNFEVGGLRIKMLKASIRLIAGDLGVRRRQPARCSPPIPSPSSRCRTPARRRGGARGRHRISIERVFGYLDKKFDRLRGVDPAPFRRRARGDFRRPRYPAPVPDLWRGHRRPRRRQRRLYLNTLAALDRITAGATPRDGGNFVLPRV